jgi:single-strand DNA-binding protein
MSRGVNSCTFIGNLGRDPEIRYSQSGNAVVNFSLAVGDRRKADGEWTDHTEWVNIVAFGKTAEACEKYLAKGSQCYVQGKMQTRKWTDKEGNDRYSTEIVANEVLFLGGKGKQQEQPNQGNDFPGDNGFDPNSDVPF